MERVNKQVRKTNSTILPLSSCLFLYIYILVLSIVSCTSLTPSHTKTNNNKNKEDKKNETQQTNETVESLIAKYPFIVKSIAQTYINLSDEEKIAQLFIIQVKQKNSYTLLQNIESKEQFYNHFPYAAGGYILFKNNIKNIAQLKNLILQLQHYSVIAPFIAIDVEGGTVNRFKHLSHSLLSTIPSARTIAQIQNPKETRAYMTIIGKTLREIGINMNLAPVADIIYPHTHAFLHSRIFSDNHQDTANYVVATASGLHDARIISVLKHFPGHGAATEDSHITLPRVTANKEELQKKDWLPYAMQISLGLDVIMMGHLSVPSLNTYFAPTSSTVIRILRQDLGFDGLIMSDSLQMNAIKTIQSKHNTNIEQQLLLTGVDILLDPRNYANKVLSLTQTFKKNTHFRSIVEKKILKILQIKFKYNIL